MLTVYENLGLTLNDFNRLVERETGFEPATSTLARLHSTTELFPHELLVYKYPFRYVNRKFGHDSVYCMSSRSSPVYTGPPSITFAKTPCSGMIHSPILL